MKREIDVLTNACSNEGPWQSKLLDKDRRQTTHPPSHKITRSLGVPLTVRDLTAAFVLLVRTVATLLNSAISVQRKHVSSKKLHRRGVRLH